MSGQPGASHALATGSPFRARTTPRPMEPWERGRLRLGQELRDRLKELDPTVPGLLDGLWDDLEHQGPGAVEKIARCAVEILERTLRAAAPDSEVLAWHQATGRPASELDRQQRPAYALRVRYQGSQLGEGTETVVAQYDSLAKQQARLRAGLQALKHASAGELAAARALLLATEDSTDSAGPGGLIEEGGDAARAEHHGG